MSRGDHARTPTVSEVVREATAIADPDGVEMAATALYDGFEDDDRPATAARHLTGELLSTVRAIDPEKTSPPPGPSGWPLIPVRSTRAITCSAEGVRLVFDGKPPEPLGRWLGERGVEV